MDWGFLKAIEEVLANEGGYVDDPDDPGGETKFGISRRSYPDLDIPNLTRDEAIAIYYRDWWQRYGYDRIDDQEIATELLDIAVTNPKAAHMNLQRACRGTGGQWVEADGYIGPLTLAAINNHPSTGWLLDRFRLLNVGFYLGLNKSRYLSGWVRRAIN